MCLSGQVLRRSGSLLGTILPNYRIRILMRTPTLPWRFRHSFAIGKEKLNNFREKMINSISLWKQHQGLDFYDTRITVFYSSGSVTSLYTWFFVSPPSKQQTTDDSWKLRSDVQMRIGTTWANIHFQVQMRFDTLAHGSRGRSRSFLARRKPTEKETKRNSNNRQLNSPWPCPGARVSRVPAPFAF